MKTLNSGSLTNLTRLAISALIASYLIWMPISSPKAIAAGFTANDGNCELIPSASGDYEISTAAELWELADCSGSSRIFRLTQDINLAGVTDAPTNSPIGTSTSPIPFIGTFDGGGKRIDGINFASANGPLGLFARMGNSQVMNLRISGEILYSGGSNNSGTCPVAAGGLAAQLEHSSTITVSNVVTAVSVQGISCLGGVFGYVPNFSTVSFEAVTNLASVSGFNSLGGLIGYLGQSEVSIKRSTNSGAIDSTGGDGTGGFVGNSGQAGGSRKTVTFIDSVNSGSISSQRYSTGGFIGNSEHNLVFVAANNTGDVTSSNWGTGGFVGYSAGSASFSGVANTGFISAQDAAGGLVGYAAGLQTINLSNNTSSVSGRIGVGGLIGESSSEIKIFKSSNRGSLTGLSSGYAIGGLIGYQSGQLSIEQSFNTGNVSAPEEVGGLIGNSGQLPTLTDVFNSGSVSGSGTKVGGFIGSVPNSVVVKISRSHQVGTVTSSDQMADALVGVGSSGYNFRVLLESVYTNQSPSTWAPLTPSAELTKATTFQGWDLDSVWGFDPTVCNYPTLRFSEPTANFSSAGCVAGGSNGGGQGGGGTNNPAPAVESPRYTGPTLQSLTAPITQGTLATFAGSKLDQVTSVLIGGAAVSVSGTTATSLTILVPALLPAGPYDVELHSSYGRLIVLSALTVVAAPVVVQPDNPTTSAPESAVVVTWRWLPFFSGNARSLNSEQVTAVRTATQIQEAKTVVCWGYTTASVPNEWARNHAIKRAEAACAAIATLRPDLKTEIRVKTGSPKSHAMRASLQFWK